MRFTTVADAAAAARRAAEVLARSIEQAQSRRGVAHVALAGGSTPQEAYRQLAGLLDDWDGVHLWFGDERCVDADDPDSNYRMVRESLLVGAGIEDERVHRIPGELGPDAGAAAYAQALRSTVPANGDGVPVLDVALLGLGEDGHTASLFAGNAALRERPAVCVGVRGAPKPPPERVTLTLAALRAARLCVMLASGAGKANAVAGVLAGPDPSIPASLLRPGTLELIVDDAAAPAGPGGAAGPGR